MYNSSNVANNIKSVAKRKDILIKDMLANCGLTVNTLANLNSGRALSSESLLIIANYLDCSTDYLLTGEEPLPKSLSPSETELLMLWNKLDPLKQAEFKGELQGYIKAMSDRDS